MSALQSRGVLRKCSCIFGCLCLPCWWPLQWPGQQRWAASHHGAIKWQRNELAVPQVSKWGLRICCSDNINPLILCCRLRICATRVRWNKTFWINFLKVFSIIMMVLDMLMPTWDQTFEQAWLCWRRWRFHFNECDVSHVYIRYSSGWQCITFVVPC